MSNRKILAWQIFGTIFTASLGSALHFVYGWSGAWKPAVLFAAANESTWEHLKIGFWPAFIFAVIEYGIYGRKAKNFCPAKMAALYAIPVLIVVLFYGYTAFLEDRLVIDIAIFAASIAAAHLLVYKILVSEKDLSNYKTSAMILIIVELLAFGLFSYFPLRNFLFLDPVTGGYGIIR